MMQGSLNQAKSRRNTPLEFRLDLYVWLVRAKAAVARATENFGVNRKEQISLIWSRFIQKILCFKGGPRGHPRKK